MTVPEKIRLLLEISGDTQQKLAQKIGVTFVALNRWINKKVIPRKNTERKIDLLLQKFDVYDAEEDISSIKKEIVDKKRKHFPNILSTILHSKDIHDSFVLALTYNSNRIEGSTLSEKDTAAIVFDNVSLSSKTLVEHLEAKNHAVAIEFLFRHLYEGGAIDEQLVLKLHGILMNAIYSDAGFYRRHGVRITGSRTVTANYLKVPDLIKNLVKTIQKTEKDSIHHTSVVHATFEQIHPFPDGNGRVGRLLLAAMLLKNNFPPAVISQKKKRGYYSALEKAQTGGDYKALYEFMIDAVLAGFKIVERVN